MDAKALKRNAARAMREAQRHLGRKTGISITCGHGHAGYGWYAYVTKHSARGCDKLHAEPLPEHVTLFSSKVADKPYEP